MCTQVWVRTCSQWSRSDVSCVRPTCQTRVCCVTCCGPTQTRRRWVGVRTTAVFRLRLVPRSSPSFYINMTSISSVVHIRSLVVSCLISHASCSLLSDLSVIISFTAQNWHKLTCTQAGRLYGMGSPWLMFQQCCLVLIFPWVLWHHWLCDRKGIRPVKNWMLVCWWWWFDWSFSWLIAPVVITTSIILSSNEIQNGDILVPANPFHREKWPLKWRMRVVW